MGIISSTLADTLDKSRDLTKWYVTLLKGQDNFRKYTFEGHDFNCIYWFVAHLTWSENSMGLSVMGGEAIDAKWLNNYSIGKLDQTISNKEEQPSFKEALNLFNQVHLRTLDHIKSLEDDWLLQDNVAGIQFGADKSNKMVLQHLIRHEAIHAGQLGWICKIYGIKTV